MHCRLLRIDFLKTYSVISFCSFKIDLILEGRLHKVVITIIIVAITTPVTIGEAADEVRIPL